MSGKKKMTVQQSKWEFIRNLQASLDRHIPSGYTGEIRTDNMSVYKKDANKFFKIFDQQLKTLRKTLGKKK